MASLYNQSLKLKYLIVLDSFLSLCYNIQSIHQPQSIPLPTHPIYWLKNITYVWRTRSVSKMLPWSSLSAFCSISTAPAQIKAFITPSFSLQNTILACVQASSFLTHPWIFSTVTRTIFLKHKSNIVTINLKAFLSPLVSIKVLSEQCSKSITLWFQSSFLAHLLSPTHLCSSFSKRSLLPK